MIEENEFNYGQKRSTLQQIYLLRILKSNDDYIILDEE